MNKDYICVRGAKENNLKSIDINIPKNCFVVITGPSGSGKSSLAFDTIYAEGQRRYIESLSSTARYFLNENNKPNVDSITGLSPAIAIDQKTTSKNPRSTVGTITEIYDYLRVLYARIGKLFNKNGQIIKKYNSSQITNIITKLPIETKIRISASFNFDVENIEEKLEELKKHGYPRVRINENIYEFENLPKLDKKIKDYEVDLILDRIVIKDGILDRISNAVDFSMKITSGLVKIEFAEFPNKEFEVEGEIFKSGSFKVFSENMFCDVSKKIIDKIEPNIFSFNSPFGACKNCHGLGYEKFFDEKLIISNPTLSIIEGAIEVWELKNKRYYRDLAIALSKHLKFDISTPYEKLPDNVKHILLYGLEDEIEVSFEESGMTKTTKKRFFGIITDIETEYENSMSGEDFNVINFEKYQELLACRKCAGFRLNESSLMIKIDNLNIGQICDFDIKELLKWIDEFQNKVEGFEKEVAMNVFKDIKLRLGFLIEVGLDYLSLNRSATTLSGGEAQRIRLASQIGSALSGVIYVLDEPSIGLHQSDNHNLIKSLRHLVSLDNSVIVVEHDEDTMRAADYLIDVGPGAGKYGGEIISHGTLEHLCKDPNSITGKFLSGQEIIEVPRARRKYGRSMMIELINARENNLKNLDLKIPLGLFVGVSGVSGSGKSTLILDTLYIGLSNILNNSSTKAGIYNEIKGFDNINKIIKIDQDPIGRTPRSNPATYTGLFILIRDIFTALPESRQRGYKSGRFSFNVKGGRCENCKGDGLIKIEMHFLPDVYITCEICNGKRYNKETLEIKYKGFSIADILEMNAREALEIFTDIPSVKEKLITLIKVGLDYIKLGQSSTTLSGGEAQRIKLSKELSKKATGDTFYILDEPTTGLHHVDIRRLLDVLHTLVDNGNTVLVIEHNLEVLKTADMIIDMGPSGGKNGGYIVAEGTPEEVAMNENSVTGKYLKPLLPKLNKI